MKKKERLEEESFCGMCYLLELEWLRVVQEKKPYWRLVLQAQEEHLLTHKKKHKTKDLNSW